MDRHAIEAAIVALIIAAIGIGIGHVSYQLVEFIQ